jgi:WD40 repeat protein
MERTRTLKLVAPPGAKWRDGAAAVMGYPARIAFSANGERCAIVSSAGLIQVFDMKTVLPIVWMEGHDQTIQSLTFTPDGRRLVTGDVTGTVKIWDCRTGLEVLKLNAHAGRVAGLAFSRDGRLLYSAGADRVIRIWDGTPIDPNAKPPQGDDTAGNGACN